MIYQRDEKKSLYASFTEKGSPGFDKFLEILGERIRLKNWDKYRGGLDIKGIFSFMWICYIEMLLWNFYFRYRLFQKL